ncbi:hypothetical protein ACVBEQ_04755 [Nakamurella sp. GG22]
MPTAGRIAPPAAQTTGSPDPIWLAARVVAGGRVGAFVATFAPTRRTLSLTRAAARGHAGLDL